MSKKINEIDMFDLSKNANKPSKKIHPDLPQLPFFMAIIGPSRSGKTNTIRNLFLRKDLYYKKFEYIFIFCPTFDLSGDFDEMVDNEFTKVRKVKNFDEAMISEIVRQQEILIKSVGKRRSPDILILLDDCFDDEKFSRSNILKRLAFRGRHAKISTILSGQKLSAMSTSCRNNLTNMLFFKPGNMSELQFFVDENCEKDKKKETAREFKEVWKKIYKFIVIDYITQDVNRRFREGFSNPLDIKF